MHGYVLAVTNHMTRSQCYLDLAYHDSVHQDISHADALTIVSNRPNPRLSLDWYTFIAITCPFKEHCQEACTTSSFSSREADASTSPRGRVLWRGSPHRWRFNRVMDSLVPRKQRSLVVCCFLAIGRSEEMEQTRSFGLLGSDGYYQRCSLESATGKI